jgi:FkbH-like protein
VLFAAEVKRRELLRLQAPWPLARRRIRIHRNHAVELALSVARPYLEFAGIAADWEVGDYDDSLAFQALDGPADVDVVWLDYTRFAERMEPGQIAEWLGGRLSALRSRTPGPILVVDWDGERAAAAPFSERLAESVGANDDVHLVDRTELFQDLGDRFFDRDRERVSGTRMSAEGAAGTARLLGSRWLPAVLTPRVRAVVVDLDNTLYDGVLGEDGIDAVILSEGHKQLHRELEDLHNTGVFLGLLSRNDPSDVEALFRARSDFPLRWEHFDARSLGWEAKSAGLRAIAGSLRVDPSTILFIDDNPGELLESVLRIPGLHFIHATDGGYETARVLQYFPGLGAPHKTEADALRTVDLRANDERERLLAESTDDLASYYRELGVTLTITHNAAEQLQRIAELSGKTNQFNLAFSRYTLGDVKALAEDQACQLSTARLEDRLSDSGVIATALARRRAETLIVEELCISCRALGRRLEDLIVAQMITTGPLFAGTERVVFRFLDGPRNQPARRWLEAFTGTAIPTTSELVSVDTDPERLLSASANPHVRAEVLR